MFYVLTWNEGRSRLATVTSKLKVAAANEIVRGGMHSPATTTKKR